MKNLPIGEQDFKNLRDGDYLYIDKTGHIADIFDAGLKHLFLARPRRFGKSLLTSMLKELFSGNKALFEGLDIYDSVEWEEFPIIKLDFSSVYSKDRPLSKSLNIAMKKIAKAHNIDLIDDEYPGMFEEIIQGLYEKHGKQVVILVDEYDKPIVDVIGNREERHRNRDALKGLFSKIKPNSGYIRFLFITGVSRFSRVSLFSDLNHLTDLTFHPSYGALTGITQEEFEKYFEDRIEELAQKREESVNELLAEIKRWYNGYSWDGETRLYNPFSILTFFSTERFKNYWFLTGTPTFLIETLQAKQTPPEKLANIQVPQSLIDDFNLDNISPVNLLFQTGYLTIKKITQIDFVLDFPNWEVYSSLYDSLFTHLYMKQDETPMEGILTHFKTRDMEKAVQAMNVILATIPPNLWGANNEASYHSVIHTILVMLTRQASAEVFSNMGRLDNVLFLKDAIYIIEYKMSTAEKALQQIKEKRYYEQYLNDGKQIILLGIAFSEKERSINDWKMELL